MFISLIAENERDGVALRIDFVNMVSIFVVVCRVLNFCVFLDWIRLPRHVCGPELWCFVSEICGGTLIVYVYTCG